MATVTIGKSYFEALLRRAEFHTSGHEYDTEPSLSNSVVISKTEHEVLLQAVREYNLLKSALFRGGLTAETLETLLMGESGATSIDEPTTYHAHGNTWSEMFVRARPVPVTLRAPPDDDRSPNSDNATPGDYLPPKQPRFYKRMDSYGQPDSVESPRGEDDDRIEPIPRVPVHDQRTILVTNLSDRTTHKDLVGIVRGGRVLDIFLRNDRTATISFVEGASEFLAFVKRKDIYLHTKRVSKVLGFAGLSFAGVIDSSTSPPHVSNKIANGASRNLVIHGATGKLTVDQIREHLDHIHNLVVVDIQFRKNDAYLSTNSIHNALFARTCMMSRTAYKGLRIDWYPDECAAPLPQLGMKTATSVPAIAIKPMPITNRYTLLETGSDLDSETDEDSYMTHGVKVNNQWSDGIVA